MILRSVFCIYDVRAALAKLCRLSDSSTGIHGPVITITALGLAHGSIRPGKSGLPELHIVGEIMKKLRYDAENAFDELNSYVDHEGEWVITKEEAVHILEKYMSVSLNKKQVCTRLGCLCACHNQIGPNEQPPASPGSATERE
jgi:hypothetical protein